MGRFWGQAKDLPPFAIEPQRMATGDIANSVWKRQIPLGRAVRLAMLEIPLLRTSAGHKDADQRDKRYPDKASAPANPAFMHQKRAARHCDQCQNEGQPHSSLLAIDVSADDLLLHRHAVGALLFRH